MGEERGLEEAPEWEHVRRWSEYMDDGLHAEALAVLEEGLRSASERGDARLADHLRTLRRITEKSASESSGEAAGAGDDIHQDKEADSSCSFCGKERAAVSAMVAGAQGFICDGCIRLCYEIISRKEEG